MEKKVVKSSGMTLWWLRGAYRELVLLGLERALSDGALKVRPRVQISEKMVFPGVYRMVVLLHSAEPYDRERGQMETNWSLFVGDVRQPVPGAHSDVSRMMGKIRALAAVKSYEDLAFNLAGEARRLLPQGESILRKAADAMGDFYHMVISDEDKKLVAAWVDFLEFLVEVAHEGLGWENCFTQATVARVNEFLERLGK